MNKERVPTFCVDIGIQTSTDVHSTIVPVVSYMGKWLFYFPMLEVHFQHYTQSKDLISIILDDITWEYHIEIKCNKNYAVI